MRILNWIKDKAVSARNFVAQQVENLKASRVAQAAQPAVAAVKNGIASVKNTIGAGITHVKTAGTNAINSAKATATNAATAAAVSVASYALKAKVEEVARIAREAAAALAAKAANWISETVRKLVAALVKFVQSIISIFANLFTGFMDKVSNKIAKTAGIEQPVAATVTQGAPVQGFSAELTQAGKTLVDDVVRAVTPTEEATAAPENDNDNAETATAENKKTV